MEVHVDGIDTATVYSTWNSEFNSQNFHFSDTRDSAKRVFCNYDENRDGVLDYKEFSDLIHQLFAGKCNGRESPPSIPDEKLHEFMNYLDINKDGKIDELEFFHAWSHCFKKVLNPVTALVIVDVQHDFIDGSLALRNCPAKQEGAEVVPVINKLIRETKFDVVVYSLDWHPNNHISFVNNVRKYPVHQSSRKSHDDATVFDEVTFDLGSPMSQVLWPAHCVQGSEGAKLHEELEVVPDAIKIYKGTKSDIDSYSAFYDNQKLSQTALLEELQRRNVTDVYVCGLAYDVCVAATSRDAVELGYRTVLINDGCRGVEEQAIANTKKDLQESGVLILNSDEVIDLVNKTFYSFDLGLFAAQTMPTTSASKIISQS